MANYGPPGGPEPWPGRRPSGWEPDPTQYGPPEYGPPEYGPSQYGPPEYRPPQYGPPEQGYPEQGYPQYGPAPEAHRPYEPHPGYDRPPPPSHPGPPPEPAWAAPDRAPRRSRGPLIAVLATLAVLVCGGGAALFYLRSQDDVPATDPTAPTSVPSGALPTDESAPTAEPAVTTPPAASTDPRFVKAGQCVRNVGATGGQPKLVITPCGAGTYQVLRRFDGATSGEKDAEAKCGKVDGYTNWYFFNSPLDTLDFVLCLKSR